MTVTVLDGQTVDGSMYTRRTLTPFPANFNFVKGKLMRDPALSNRIRRMSKRRQKIAIARQQSERFQYSAESSMEIWSDDKVPAVLEQSKAGA